MTVRLGADLWRVPPSMQVGSSVWCDGLVWTVLSKAPGRGAYWLGRRDAEGAWSQRSATKAECALRRSAR